MFFSFKYVLKILLANFVALLVFSASFSSKRFYKSRSVILLQTLLLLNISLPKQTAFAGVARLKFIFVKRAWPDLFSVKLKCALFNLLEMRFGEEFSVKREFKNCFQPIIRLCGFTFHCEDQLYINISITFRKPMSCCNFTPFS